MAGTFPKAGRKNLAPSANLANLLPTGTVLAFQALVPSFSNNGECTLSNKFLTLSFLIGCGITCFLCSFTDSFRDDGSGKIYYGFTTFKGLHVLNDTEGDDVKKKLSEDEDFKITGRDFVHAFGSVFVFLVFAISSADVQDCFYPEPGVNEQQLIMNLPLAAGVLGSALFMLIPTKRRGIGYADMSPHERPTKEKGIP